MANFVNDFLTANPDLASQSIERARHGLHFRNGSDVTAILTGKPVHYLDTTGWHAIDTALQYDSSADDYGAPGLLPRIKANGLVRIPGSDYQQQTTRIGTLNPANGNLNVIATLGMTGSIVGDTILRTTDRYEHRLTLTETGLRETLTLLQAPPAGYDNLWLVLETAISGATFPDGWLDASYLAGGYTFPLPVAHDDNRVYAPVRRYARTRGGIQYVYTGIPFSWLYDASYPVEIDPDFTGDASDGVVYGDNPTYATAQATATANIDNNTYLTIAQLTNYRIYRTGLKFITSSIPTYGTVSAVTMTLYADWKGVTTNFDIQIREFNWASSDPLAPETREAFYDGSIAATLDQVWKNTSAITAGNSYTSPALDPTWIVKGGTTYYALTSSADASSTAPTGNDEIDVASATSTTPSHRPYLSITYTTRSADRVHLPRGLSVVN